MLRRMSVAVTQQRRRPQALFGRHQQSTSATASTAVFKPWKTPVIECHGDYRQEAWLEDHIGGPLYEHQKQLPRLPIPSIDETLERFLPTALPLARSESERQALQQAVDKFPQQAAALQERLKDRANNDYPDSSWLQHWWNTLGYLQVRDSVVINVSYYFHFSDDAPHACTNVKRAAAFLSAVADARAQICTGSWPAEAVGRGDRRKILDSTAYKYMLHACRIPAKHQDSYNIYDPAKYNHAVVVRHGQFYKMDFCDADTGAPLSLASLEGTIQQIIETSDANNDPSMPKLGWLTSQNRDAWADARSELLNVGGKEMEQALEDLQSGAVVICLEDDDCVSRRECAEVFLHGSDKAYNRWFDKSIQLVIAPNGKAGLVGEHSMMDGMPVVQFADYVTRKTYKKCQQEEAQRSVSDETAKFEPIFSNSLLNKLSSSSAVGQHIEEAKNAHLDVVSRHSIDAESFQGYGSDFMKKYGFSPDAYGQVIMQLATYRLFGEQVGTYEATQVRPFLHGRTETTRSVSLEAADFVNAMGFVPQHDEDDDTIRKNKLDLFRKAVDAHVIYIGNAAKARGVDRHFLGLSMLVNDGESAPDLYADPVFVRSKRWRVSTSHLIHPKFENWGYGEVVPDGVGLSYAIHPRHCIFSVTALKDTKWSDKLCRLLEEALLEVRQLIELDEAIPKSKL